MKRASIALVAVILAAPLLLPAQEGGAVAAGHPDVRRVLLVGAHPDDEDTNLIAWLQRGGRAHTAYLSLTRGDGGQNLIGNELGEELGIIRTEELLAARRVDGAHQFFSRAYDFGYSKSAEETYAHWPKDSLLNDVVAVVRAWRPHVIVAMFSGTPRDGHGHHQVSAMLAREAYDAAGDTVRFPVRDFGPAWTPLKFYRTARFDTTQATLKVNVGEYDEGLRRSYAEIAGESLSQHKSQGFGRLQRRGVVWNYVSRVATRVNEGTPAASETSMFDGIAAGGVTGPGASADSVAPHIFLDAFADRREVAAGDTARVVATLYNRSRRTLYVTPELTEGVAPRSAHRGVPVLPDSSFTWILSLRGTTITQPWWLTSPRNGDLFAPPLPRLADAANWRWMPENERSRGHVVAVAVRLDSLGPVSLVREAPVVYRFLDPVRGDVQRPIAVTPPISVALDNAFELARANVEIDRFVNVTLRSAVTKPQPLRVSLSLPAGLTADSISRTVTLDSAGTRRMTFRIRGRLKPGVHTVSASASAGEQAYASGYIPIDYEHITPQRLYRPASMQLRAVEVQVPAGTNLAYVQGVGDKVAISLQQLGIPVTVIRASDIPTVDLSKFSAVVTGPRAYDAHRELIDNNTYLLDYARGGGTLVVQYGQYEMMRPGVMPYPVSISRPHDRVTEETAPIRILDPSAPVLNRPNRVTGADFEGWVQERGLYMPRTFDERYRPVLETNDPGAPPNRGGIIVAPYGRGTYVYTTLAFFRQLPAGVGGAAKLFVNLVTQGAQ
ncbi:MAG: PIG-L family deacetylase [Gemmatimonadaceae bacterium]